MITKSELKRRQLEAHAYFQKAKLVITPAEQEQIEVADFGLSEFEKTGLGVLVYVNTLRCCAKELAMWPRQTCPEHRHPNVGGQPGKEETFRTRNAARPRAARRPTPSGVRSCSTRATNTPSHPTPRTGSRPATRARWFRNSPRTAPTKTTSSPTNRSVAPRRWLKENHEEPLERNGSRAVSRRPRPTRLHVPPARARRFTRAARRGQHLRQIAREKHLR